MARVTTDDRAGAVDDVARPVGEPGVPGQEGRLASAGEEAQVLRLGLGGDGSPASAASSRTCGLVRSPSGKRSRASVEGVTAASMYVWSLAGSAAARRSPSSVTRA